MTPGDKQAEIILQILRRFAGVKLTPITVRMIEETLEVVGDPVTVYSADGGLLVRVHAGRLIRRYVYMMGDSGKLELVGGA